MKLYIPVRKMPVVLVNARHPRAHGRLRTLYSPHLDLFRGVCRRQWNSHKKWACGLLRLVGMCILANSIHVLKSPISVHFGLVADIIVISDCFKNEIAVNVIMKNYNKCKHLKHYSNSSDASIISLENICRSPKSAYLLIK